MNIEIYKPSETVINKIVDYRNKGSMVNVGAIKNENKLYTYYYVGKLIGWNDLCYDIEQLSTVDSDILGEIDKVVKPDSSYQDHRTKDQIRFSKLFPELARILYKNNILDYKFLDRLRPESYELEKDRRNGLCYTCAYRLIINDTIIIDFTRHSNESKPGGSFGFSIGWHEYSTKKEFIAAMIKFIGNQLGFPLIV